MLVAAAYLHDVGYAPELFYYWVSSAGWEPGGPLRGEFQARPLFRAPRGTVAVGATPGELIAQMTAIRAAAPRRVGTLPGIAPRPA